MAQYRCSVSKPISRGKGQSAIAKAAYNAREKMRDERTGQVKDYSRDKEDVLFSGIFLDPRRNAPEWAQDRAALWHAAVAAEKRKDAREGQEIILNLPYELTDEQRRFMLTDFVREQITRNTGRVADVNIHRPPRDGDDRNYHAHVLMTVREIGPGGFGEKRLETTPDQIQRWKEKWAERGAKELRKAGFEIEADRWAVGHLSLDRQRQAALERGDLAYAETLDKEPTKHRGPGASAMERKGVETDRGNAERETLTASQETAKLKQELAEIDRQIAAIEREAERQPGREQTAPVYHFEDAGRNTTRDTRPPAAPPPLHGMAAHVLSEWSRSESRDFAAALDGVGIRFAIATKEEAERSHREAEFAKTAGNYAPRFKEGELAVVTEPGLLYRRDGEIVELRRVYKFQPEAEKFLPPLDRTKLQGIDATKQLLEKRSQGRREDVAAARLERATNTGDGRDRTIKAANDNTRKLSSAIRKTSARVIGAALGAIGRLVESLFQFLDPGPPKTRKQMEQEAREGERAAEAAATAQQAAQQHEISEAEYERTKQRWAEQSEQRDQAGRDFKRYRDDDRDRQ